MKVAELAEELEVGVARARELADRLVEEVGIAEYLPGSPRRVALRGFVRGEPSHEVAIAACFASALAPLFEGSKIQPGMRDALEFVTRSSPRPEKFKDVDRKFVFVRAGGEMALPRNAKLLERLGKAVLDQRVVSMTYSHFALEREDATETFRPLSIAIYGHQVYLLGVRERDERLRLIRFSRVKKVRTLSRGFAYPDPMELNPAEVFRDALGVFLPPEEAPVEQVVVALDETWAGYARSHRWHPSQVVEEVDDGAVLVKLRVKITPEVESWVLGFGEHAAVRAPDSLRKTIAARIERLRAVYRDERSQPQG
jgi:predicted DNA-binding transcriptional regulator YafY